MPGITDAPTRRRRGQLVPVLLAGLIAAGLIAAGSVGSTAGAAPPPAPSTIPVSLPLPAASLPAEPPEVLPALSDTAPAPTSAGLVAALTPLLARPALGPSVSTQVLDPVSAAEIYSSGADRPAVPASTAKLLTAAAALSALGPDTTLATRVVLAPGAAGSAPLVLIGGGDVMLGPDQGDPDSVQGHAGMADLAAATAQALRGRGIGRATLQLDDTLFAAPAVAPGWGSDVGGGFVAPVMAVELTVGVVDPSVRPQPELPVRRVADPAMSAARRLAVLLAADGIQVTGQITRSPAPAGAIPLAEVRSAPIGDLVEYGLTVSDNTLAEALARLVAVAGHRPADFAGAGAAVLAAIAAAGVPVGGARMPGGSGLGPGYALTARTIAATLALAVGDQPRLRPLLSGLPVAGASGTLRGRFGGAAAGTGVVRAKTGTLTGVAGLAGTVVDADGKQLVFVVIADAAPARDPARAALDDVAAALATCGCRS